jgi:hypothetical protein
MQSEANDDVEDIFRQMRSDMDAADARVQPWQAEIRAGDYFVKDSLLGFPIYGQILEEHERRPSHLKHYRLCRAYSMACPQGEMGDIHVSSIEALISQEKFSEAREKGWRPP